MSIGKTVSLIALVLLLLSAGACISTHMTQSIDPDYDGRRYASLVIGTPDLDIGLRKKIELAFCNEFSEEHPGVRTDPAWKVFPPTREYPDLGTVMSRLRRRGIAGYLEVVLIRWDEYPGMNTGLLFEDDLLSIFLDIAERERVLRFNIRLYDTETRRCVWKASSRIEGSDISGFSGFARALAERAGREMSRAGLLEE